MSLKTVSRPATAKLAPTLVFAWGNASRGDDALGPLLAQRLRALLPADGAVEVLDDYQLQPEHALDLVGRERVLFVDASRDSLAPIAAAPVLPAADTSFSTHALSPAALLQVFRQVQGQEPPPATLLVIRGRRFGLGEPLSAEAQGHLQAALTWVQRWLTQSHDQE